MANDDLMSRMKKIGNTEALKYTHTLDKSLLVRKTEMVPTKIKAINIALSGSIDGGLTSGFMMLAGESKNFKTMYALILVSAYLKKYSDAILCFYDTEFGANLKYFQSVGIDMSRVLHIPITDVDQLTSDLVQKFHSGDKSAIHPGEKCIILIDSLGGMASLKEIEDARKESGAKDMTRAQKMKGLFRIMTPLMGILDIPMIGIAHIYKTQEMYSKTVVSGGQGGYLGANDIWVVSRTQEKDGDEKTGWNFNIRIEKSRTVKEGSKIPVYVDFKKGVQTWSGMYDIAVELGYITTPTKGYRWRPMVDGIDPETGEIKPYEKGRNFKLFREEEIKDSEITNSFFKELFDKTDFADAIKKHYMTSQGALIHGDDTIEDEVLTNAS